MTKCIARMRCLTIVGLIYFFSAIWHTTLAGAGERVALVIGNGAYLHAAALANPANDAADMTATLKRLGFTVIEGGINLTKAQMDTKLKEFNKALANAESGLFFYAGHGLQVSGENYLIPIDAELSNIASLDTETVHLTAVQRIMEINTKQNMLFFDACRNNPFVRSLAGKAGSRNAVAPGLTLQYFGVGTLISFSAQPDSVASDGNDRNSPYTGPLVRLIENSDEDVVSILMNVRKEVLSSTRGEQVPWNQDSLLNKIYIKSIGAPNLSLPPMNTPVATSAELSTQRSVWVHNDSEFLLLTSGDHRAFYYKKPSRSVARAGVKAGTLLFEGKLEGEEFVGTAYRFSKKCPTLSYNVRGPVEDAGRTIRVEGVVQRRDTDTCTMGEAYTDELQFRYLRME